MAGPFNSWNVELHKQLPGSSWAEDTLEDGAAWLRADILADWFMESVESRVESINGSQEDTWISTTEEGVTNNTISNRLARIGSI